MKTNLDNLMCDIYLVKSKKYLASIFVLPVMIVSELQKTEPCKISKEQITCGIKDDL